MKLNITPQISVKNVSPSHSKSYMRFFFVILILLQVCSSCNFLKLVDRKQEKRFLHEGMPLAKFKDVNGVHAVHASNKGRQKVVLVHGYGASGIGQYFRSAIELNADYDVILPDLLYCGRSVGNGVDFSIDAQAKHLNALLDSLEISEPVVLIGNSYGGIVSAFFTEMYPERVAKLVIYDSPVGHYKSAYADSLAHSFGIPSFKELLAPTTIKENKVSLDLIFYDQPYIPRFLRRQMIKYGSIPARPTQLKLLDELLEHEAELNAYTFNWKVPIYLCWGDSDLLIPVSTMNGISQHYGIPADRVKIFKKAAHAANVEYPKEFVAYVKTLLAEDVKGK